MNKQQWTAIHSKAIGACSGDGALHQPARVSPHASAPSRSDREPGHETAGLYEGDLATMDGLVTVRCK